MADYLAPATVDDAPKWRTPDERQAWVEGFNECLARIVRQLRSTDAVDAYRRAKDG